jgi:uncharacterized protein (TIGR00299 family) protein
LSLTSHIHLDPIGGIAGDMFISAMLDTFPDLEAEAFAAMFAAGLPSDWSVERRADKRAGIAGSHLSITPSADGLSGPGHKSYAALREMIAAAPLDEPVRERALDMLRLLGEAEAKVHGVGMEKVHFHELAGWDSLADLAAAAWLIERVAPDSWSVGPLPLGHGRVRTEHGPLPVPAPATTELLKGFDLVDDGVVGERITPTGAAILKTLQPAMRRLPGRQRLQASGTGLGTSNFPGIANCLRVLAFAVGEDAMAADIVGVIDFFVDDQTPEDLAIGLGRIAGDGDVLDVQQAAALGRKGRLGNAVTVMCRPDAVERVADLCFRETATIGLRTRLSQRLTLTREFDERDVDGQRLPRKLVRRPGGAVTAKVEADALADSGEDASGRERLRRLASGDDGAAP